MCFSSMCRFWFAVNVTEVLHIKFSLQLLAAVFACLGSSHVTEATVQSGIEAHQDKSVCSSLHCPPDNAFRHVTVDCNVFAWTMCVSVLFILSFFPTFPSFCSTFTTFSPDIKELADEACTFAVWIGQNRQQSHHLSRNWPFFWPVKIKVSQQCCSRLRSCVTYLNASRKKISSILTIRPLMLL